MASLRVFLLLAMCTVGFLMLTVIFVVTWQWPLLAMMSFGASFATGVAALVTLRRSAHAAPPKRLTVPIWSARDDYMATTDTCPICLDPLVRGVVSLPCTHAFHEGCIALWFQQKTSCPICMKHYEPQ